MLLVKRKKTPCFAALPEGAIEKYTLAGHDLMSASKERGNDLDKICWAGLSSAVIVYEGQL